MNDGMRLRARVLLRARWRAVVALGVVAGILGGGLIALATAARETDESLDRYMAGLDTLDHIATICPPGSRADDPSVDCSNYEASAEVARLRADERVEAAGRFAATPTFMRTGPGGWSPMFAYVALDDLPVFGRPPVVDGEPADHDDPGQVMVNETFAWEHGVEVGDRIEIAPQTWEQMGTDTVFGAPTAPALTATVTAILRTPDDLHALDSSALQLIESAIFLGPGWARSVGEDDFARYGTGIALRTRPGTDLEDVLATAAPGQDASLAGSVWDVTAFAESVRYDARAAYAATAIAAVAAAAFLVQLVARQARREVDDAEPLRALGVTPAMLVQSAVGRWALSAGLAVVVAAPVAALLRPLGPIGLGRHLLGRPPISLDAAPAIVGLGATSALVLGIGLTATWFAARPARIRPARAHGRLLPVGASPTASTGLTLGFSVRNGRWTVTTVLAVAVAVAAAVASATIVHSLGDLTSEPDRFGASWDVSIASVVGPAATDELARTIGDLPGVEAAAGLVGNDASIGDDELFTYAVEPVPGLPEGIAPVITRGRVPAAPGEVALGALSMERAGVDLGDTVALTYLDRTEDLLVVGEALVNDGYEDLPGVGAIVDHRWLRARDAQTYASDLVVRFEPAARESGIAALQEAYPDTAVRPPVPSGILELERIDTWPALLTAFAVALAVATFAHALVVAVRRQRRQLGVLRALGFSRRQVRRSVGWLASLTMVAAAVIGLPLGIALGRWGWSRFAHNLGVPSRAVVVTVSIVLAQLIAFPVGWRAARGQPADALRAE